MPDRKVARQLVLSRDPFYLSPGDEALAGMARALAGALDEMLRLLPPTAKRKGSDTVAVEDAKRYYADALAGLLKDVRSLLFDTIHSILAGKTLQRSTARRRRSR